MSIDVMKQALEALDVDPMREHWAVAKDRQRAITALRQAIAEAEQVQPVAWVVEDQNGERLEWADVAHIGWGWKKIPLYTAPPKRQPLTDEQTEAEFKAWHRKHGNNTQGIKWVDDLLRSCWKAAIEAANGIKGEA